MTEDHGYTVVRNCDGFELAQEGGYTVTFVLPDSMTAQTAPEPTNQKVTIRTVPPSLAAAARFSGRSSQACDESHRTNCSSGSKLRVSRWLGHRT